MTASRTPRRLLAGLVTLLMLCLPGTVSAETPRVPELPAVAEVTDEAADAEVTSTARPGQPDRRAERTAWTPHTTTATLDHVADVIRANRGARQQGTGAGVGVALIDTGVAPVTGLTDVFHGPDLSLDSPFSEAHQLDAYGHGTHLAGIIASDRDDARGIAPDATLVSVKVGAHNGAVDTSQVIAGIDWVVQNREHHNIRVLVLAYGTDGVQDPVLDPLAHAVQTAWRNGIVVVVAAGNEGEVRPALANPATDPYVIAVGAADTQGTARGNDDARAPFSAPGTDQRRPDVVAPGVGVVSSGVPGSFIAETYPAAVRPDDLLRGNGTSQAAAVVGGAVAALLEHRPDLTPDEVKALLIRSASPIRGDAGTGAGMIDLHRASRLPVGRDVTQTHPVSTGTGTLEGARGSHHLIGDGIPLQGEVDIMGQPFDSNAWAQAATDLSSWQDGTWNSVRWTGVGWNGWSWNGWSWNEGSWGGWSWNDLSWGGWSWNGWSWRGEAWQGWNWNGWSWNGWSWNGWSWNATWG